MTVTEASDEHIETIRAIAEASWSHDHPEMLNRGTVSEGFDEWYGSDRIEAELANPKSMVFVASEEEPVGFVHGMVDGDDGVVLRLYVHPDHRQQGTGRKLFERIKDELLEYGVDRIQAMVLAENTLGNEFYRQLGFEQVSEGVTTIGQERFDENIYKLRISEDSV